MSEAQCEHWSCARFEQIAKGQEAFFRQKRRGVVELANKEAIGRHDTELTHSRCRALSRCERDVVKRLADRIANSQDDLAKVGATLQ